MATQGGQSGNARPGAAAGGGRGAKQGSGLWGVLALGMLTFLVAGGVGLFLLTRSDPSRKGYDQRSPEGVLKTARLMVEGGHAERLGELMYAESPEWRELYLRLGELLGDMQDLADTVAVSMPEEVEQVKADAVAAAAEGRAANYLEQLFTGRRAVPRASSGGPSTIPGASRPGGPDPRRILNDTLKQISADPYGWLEETEGRLGFEWIDDFTVALTWDGSAIAPPIGITLKQADDGLWYLMLPTSLPQVRPVVPDTPEEFGIWASLVQVMRNAVQDMRASVASREVTTLDDLSMKAGENLIIPMGLVMVAYGKMVEEDMRAQREAGRAARRGAPAARGGEAPADAAAPAGDAPAEEPSAGEEPGGESPAETPPGR